MLSLLLSCWKTVFPITSVFSWQNSCQPLSCFILYSTANLPITPGISLAEKCLFIYLNLRIITLQKHCDVFCYFYFLLLHSSPLWWKGHLFLHVNFRTSYAVWIIIVWIFCKRTPGTLKKGNHRKHYQSYHIFSYCFFFFRNSKYK